MNFKKYNKLFTVLCILLIAIILIILFKSDLFTFKDKKNSSPNNVPDTVINMAFISNPDCSDEKTRQITQALDTISEEFEKTYDVFNTDNYNNSYEDAITAATGRGASLIICPDSSFEETVYNLQSTYVNVYFLIIDGIPHNSDYSDSAINYNVIPIIYDNADIGFLAGYALAYEGYKNVGFTGPDISQSAHYFYGLLNGINYASQSLNINDITVNYCYTSKESCENVIEKMYNNKNDIVATYGSTFIKTAENICDKVQKPCIVCSDNYNTDNPYIIAKDYKNIYDSLYDCIYNLYKNNITGGSSIKYSADNDSIGLIFKEDSFNTFNSEIYNNIYKDLADNKITIISDTTIAPEDLELPNIKVYNIKFKE